MAVEQAALYQTLHRLENQLLVTAEWGLSENNRKARCYRLTPQGRRHLRTRAETWNTLRGHCLQPAQTRLDQHGALPATAVPLPVAHTRSDRHRGRCEGPVHLDMRTTELIQQGMDARSARDIARREFGNAEDAPPSVVSASSTSLGAWP